MAKILLVEDDPSINKVVSTKLQREGFEVIIASDGEEGFRRIKSDSPDLIILDIMLPKRDGFWVLEEMKIDPEMKKYVPVIVLSNLGQPKDVDLAMKLGAKDYMIKTELSLAALIDKINSYLDTGAKKQEE